VQVEFRAALRFRVAGDSGTGTEESEGAAMNELERAPVGDSYAVPLAHILEGLRGDLVHRDVAGAPHTLYQELWHIAFWQQVTLDWIDGIETPYPLEFSAGFPAPVDVDRESRDQLRQRFLRGSEDAAAIARDAEKLEQLIRCPSRPGAPVRTMSVREQLESLAAHNAYHLGRIVLLRQLSQARPPPSGGYSW
jgi:uncharacterized damage-inducible protein DinB